MANMMADMFRRGQPQQAPVPAPVEAPVPAHRPPQNPAERMQAVVQAMQNPFGYLRQVFPDIPAYMANNPGQIMQYLQRTRNISQEDIRATVNQISQFR